MENVAVASATWLLVGVLNLVLAGAVHLREDKHSVLFTSPVLVRATAWVLVWFVVLFSVYTWGFVDAFVFSALERLLLARDLEGWHFVTDVLCAILAFTAVQALCLAAVGMFVALESELTSTYLVVSWPGLMRTLTAVLCVFLATFASCSVICCAFVLYLSGSLHERPQGVPWDAALVAVQSMLFVLACVLFAGARVRSVSAPEPCRGP